LVDEGETKLDPVRALLVRLCRERNISLRKLSLVIGRNHAYLRAFVHVGEPHILSDEVRQALGRRLGVDPDVFRPSGLVEDPPRLRFPGEPINPDLMHEAEAIADRLVPGDSAEHKRNRTEVMAFAVWLLERQAAGIPVDLRDENLLRRLEMFSHRLQTRPKR
jgi:hypothetical protein